MKKGKFLETLLLLAGLFAGGGALHADPQPVGSEFEVNLAALGSPGRPDVAVGAAGFVVVWEGSGIYFRRYDSGGAPLGKPVLIEAPGTTAHHSAVVASQQDGDFVVVWQGKDVSTGTDHIYARTYSAAGVAQMSPLVVDDLQVAGPPSAPAVAYAESGDFLVAYQRSVAQQGEEIFVRIYHADVSGFGDEKQVNAITAGDQAHPVVAVARLPVPGFYVAWDSDDDDEGDIYLQHLDKSGDTLLESELLVNDPATEGAQTAPAIAVSDLFPDPSGRNRLVVVWQGPVSEVSRIWYRLFDTAAAPQTGQTLADTNNDAPSQTQPDVGMPSVMPEGIVQFVATWSQETDPSASLLGVGSVIVGARRPRTEHSHFALADPEFTISSGGYVSDEASLALDHKGNFVCVWNARDAEQTDSVLGRRYGGAFFEDGFETGGTHAWSDAFP